MMEDEDWKVINKANDVRKKIEDILEIFPQFTKAFTQSWNCYCCKYYKYQNLLCKKHNCKMNPNDFCSYFKRATSNDRKEKKS